MIPNRTIEIALEAIARLEAIPVLVARVIPAARILDPEDAVRVLANEYATSSEDARVARRELLEARESEQKADRLSDTLAQQLAEIRSRLAEANGQLARERDRSEKRQTVLDQRKAELAELRRELRQLRQQADQVTQ